MFIYHSLFALLGRPIVGIWICANINRCVSREEVASYYVTMLALVLLINCSFVFLH